MAASEERETIIRLSPSEPGIAHIWTTEPKYWRKFAKAGYKPLPHSSRRGHFYEVDARLVHVRSRLHGLARKTPRIRQSVGKEGQSL